MEDDRTLLREYAATKSESAFAALVSRHINFVYSAALRQVRDRHLAEEVTQVVFIILARKAGSISPNAVLSGWLFKTVRFTASAQVKAAIRRQRREQEANMNSVTLQETPDHTWERMSPMLDEALAKLNEKDRQAVLLRYFEKKSLAQVGGALAVNEDTARKRVGRAVEKLRQFFARRGVALSAIAIGGALSTQAVQAAPVGLAATISTTAVKGSAVAASTLTLLKGALKLMTWAKLKVAAAVGTAAIVVAATAVAIEKIAVQSGAGELVTDSSVVQVDSATKDVVVAANTVPSAGATPSAPQKVPARRIAASSEIDDSVFWSQLDSRALSTLPAAFIVRPTHFGTQSGGMVSSRSSKDGEKMLGRAISFRTLIGAAYGVPASRILFPAGMPGEKVDVLMTVPSGSKEMLQEEIRKQFGLVASREMREGDVLALKIKNAEAPGLKPSQQQDATIPGGGGGFGGGGSSSRSSTQVVVRTGQAGGGAGGGSVRSTSRNGLKQYSAQHQTIDGMIQNLQSHFDATLYDETGLTGSYDISLKWESASDSPASEAVKTAMLEQLGLELTPGRAQIEMLVVQKAE